MITDNSGLPSIGLAILRKNLDKLTPAEVHLSHRGVPREYVLTVDGPEERFESTSFAWGDDSIKSEKLIEALKLLGVNVYGRLDANHEYSL